MPAAIRVLPAAHAPAQWRALITETQRSDRATVIGNPGKLEGSLQALTSTLLLSPPCMQHVVGSDRTSRRSARTSFARHSVRLVGPCGACEPDRHDEEPRVQAEGSSPKRAGPHVPHACSKKLIVAERIHCTRPRRFTRAGAGSYARAMVTCGIPASAPAIRRERVECRSMPPLQLMLPTRAVPRLSTSTPLLAAPRSVISMSDQA